MPLRIFITFAIFFLVGAFSSAFAEPDPTALSLPRNIDLIRKVRVAVENGKTGLSVRFDQPYFVETIQTGEELAYRIGGADEIRSIRNGLRIGDEEIKIYGVRLASPSRRIYVGDREYRGKVQIIRQKDATLTVINEIDAEVYLRGVLPKEIPANWPAEALKAQAVAARTYALFGELKEFDKDFSLKSTVESQVYGGESAAESRTSEAVWLTEGEVLLYNGRIFRTYFHSSCGGHTYRADYVWDVEPHPALAGVRCSFCQGAPGYRWEADYTAGELTAQLRKAGFNVGTAAWSGAGRAPGPAAPNGRFGVRSLFPSDTDYFGRARSVWLRHDGGDSVLNGNEFRMAAGAGKIRSMNFDVEPTGGGFHFSGLGFGHGVGLCQWGMKRLAEEGKTYREILAYYYPGSSIETIY